MKVEESSNEKLESARIKVACVQLFCPLCAFAVQDRF